MRALLLASSSPYRRELLNRLRLPFSQASPDIDESPRANETPRALVSRLAREKAEVLVAAHPRHLIIGSDQVAVLCGGTNAERVLGKPHTLDKAREQLQAASGRSVSFLTGLALLDAESGRCQVDVVSFTVHFRQLTEAQVERYLLTEQPFDCAGSFKAEGLGVSLFRRTEGDDATSLVGLPLIRLVDMLLVEEVGVL
jgi:MAF protein